MGENGNGRFITWSKIAVAACFLLVAVCGILWSVNEAYVAERIDNTEKDIKELKVEVKEKIGEKRYDREVAQNKETIDKMQKQITDIHTYFVAKGMKTEN